MYRFPRLFVYIPEIDPLKKNIKKFKKYYTSFVILVLVFMLYIHLWTLLWNLGYKISSNIIMPLGISVLFFYIGTFLDKIQRNWFIGIRTPWTLSNNKIWSETHKIGGKLFKISGVIAFIGIFFHDYTFWFIIIPIVISSIFLVLYSYLLYRRTSHT